MTPEADLIHRAAQRLREVAREATSGLRMDPLVAVALAELLDEAERYAVLPRWREYRIAVRALALARAVLGEPED